MLFDMLQVQDPGVTTNKTNGLSKSPEPPQNLHFSNPVTDPRLTPMSNVSRQNEDVFTVPHGWNLINIWTFVCGGVHSKWVCDRFKYDSL